MKATLEGIRTTIHVFLKKLKRAIWIVFNTLIGSFTRSILKTLNLSKIVSLEQLILQNAIQESANFAINNFKYATYFSKKQELWINILDSIPSLNSEGVIAEFGVYKGDSINFFAERCKNVKIFGFDSFFGLEENWYGFKYKKGHFNLNGAVPKVKPNVKIYKGLFEETLPNFIEILGPRKIDIIHLDADTYKPTSFVLKMVSNNLKDGTIIIFDEFFGYPNFQLHEFKAWEEFQTEFKIEFKYIAFTSMAVAIRINYIEN